VIGREEFRRLADLALDASQGDHTVVSLAVRKGGTARFANNQIVQHVNIYRHELTVRVAVDGRTGSSSTTELSPRAIAATTARAQHTARVSPPDPEYLPPLPAQVYEERDTFRKETAAAGPARLIRDAREAIKICQAADLEGAGIVSAYTATTGVAADTGLFAHEHRTRAEFSLTATGGDSSGWVKNAHRSIDRLGVVDRAHKAVDKAKRSAGPKEIPAGRYTVILEPAAVAGLLGPLSRAAGAKAYYRGTSALAGKLDQPVVDARLTLRNDPRHPALLGRGFSEAGLPSDEATWIENGVLRRLDYDRFTAKEHGPDGRPRPGHRARYPRHELLANPLRQPDRPDAHGHDPRRDVLDRGRRGHDRADQFPLAREPAARLQPDRCVRHADRLDHHGAGQDVAAGHADSGLQFQ
jgi:predicted Zn-dependent protease